MSSKDHVADVPEKKKRRTIKMDKQTEPAGPTPGTVETKTVKIAPDNRLQTAQANRALFHYEENEVSNRDPKKDLELHQRACNELRRVMSEVKDLKESDQKDTSDELDELRIHGTLQFVTLRKLNRLAHLRSKKVRETTSEAKQKIDQHHLRLQNLLYEVMHLQKETAKCLQFKSKDEEVSLISVEQFYKEAPVEISKPKVTRNDGHQLTLARLDWELEQRKRLSAKLREAQSQKNLIQSEISSKKEYLDSLQPKLSAVLQATKPVQDYLGMPFDETREQHRTATYLPPPLYVLYKQSSAYAAACDKYLVVSIEGDFELAQTLEEQPVDIDDDSDSEPEETDKPTEKRHRRNTEDSRLNRKREKLLKKHPLSVCVVVKCRDKSQLVMTFYYLMSLEVVTVKVKLTTAADAGTSTISGGDLLNTDTLLSCLYPGDYGDESPNTSNNFSLEKLCMADFVHYVGEIGRPYQWVQWMCGLQFLETSDRPPRAQSSVSASHIQTTIKKLRARIKSRLSLQRQLAALERNTVPVDGNYIKLFPTKINSRLISWKRSTWEDFSACKYTQRIVRGGIVSSNDLYFIAILERGSATITAQISVKPDYPNSAPVVALYLLWKTVAHDALNDEAIREMEAEINVHYGETIDAKYPDQLLTNQIQRLLFCFDVYLETEMPQLKLEGPTEFAHEKICPRLARGKSRSKPYNFNAQHGFFSQR